MIAIQSNANFCINPSYSQPPNIREAMDKLDKVDQRMNEEEMQLNEIETLIERVELESVDGPISDLYQNNNSNVEEASRSGKEDELKKQLFQQYPELRMKIALFSNRLDTLASTIDSVNSHQDMEIKTRKKKLSNKIVAMMSCLDNKMMSLGVRL